MGRPPSILRGRLLTTTYLYDDPEDPARITGSVTTPEWTEDDRAALLGLEVFEGTLCRCGEPKTEAWHSHSEGEYLDQAFVCHACSAQQGMEVVYHAIVEWPTETKLAKYPPFDIAVTTTLPTKKES